MCVCVPPLDRQTDRQAGWVTEAKAVGVVVDANLPSLVRYCCYLKKAAQGIDETSSKSLVQLVFSSEEWGTE